MIQHLLLVVAALASSPADRAVRAPTPKAQEVPSIEGTYTLNYTSLLSSRAGPGGWGGAAGPAGGGGARVAPVFQTVLRRSNARITKNAITIGISSFDNGGDLDEAVGFSGRAGIGVGQTLSYSINPATTPMSIDISVIDVRNKKTSSLGIIEVVDDRITIAVAKPGAERPKNTDESEEVTLYYFKKTPPPPRDDYRIVAMTVGKEAEAEKELNRLAKEGYQLVNATHPSASDPKLSVTTVHFVLKKTIRE